MVIFPPGFFRFLVIISNIFEINYIKFPISNYFEISLEPVFHVYCRSPEGFEYEFIYIFSVAFYRDEN
ncbi:hypothetical protein DU48_17970 [Methanosarcina mazei]|uniref:Uncharacterized protein n=1 Tax=Methanosarcina mazei TaxID=2209 RepID=A0A0F8G510_METMZ|nr:hypothetical protein DU40_07025 [Methanosarcina mazei]KKG16143.1 hypothetical protein DU34_13095 [Methanosarcina mazei]KKG34223.1 hypothetical protein DU49_04730 [Methanosarcina mazei]KKG40104.1 hypothetical protein DU39_03675 [Methanosarcina mazei]KKG40613.1 hypothetical protein DU35_04095 [Methanosarcina mazei]